MSIHLFRSLLQRWQRPKRVKPAQLHQQLAKDASPIILDVRNPEEFNGELGHISGAMLIPLAELKDRLSELATSRDYSIITV